VHTPMCVCTHERSGGPGGQAGLPWHQLPVVCAWRSAGQVWRRAAAFGVCFCGQLHWQIAGTVTSSWRCPSAAERGLQPTAVAAKCCAFASEPNLCNARCDGHQQSSKALHAILTALTRPGGRMAPRPPVEHCSAGESNGAPACKPAGLQGLQIAVQSHGKCHSNTDPVAGVASSPGRSAAGSIGMPYRPVTVRCAQPAATHPSPPHLSVQGVRPAGTQAAGRLCACHMAGEARGEGLQVPLHCTCSGLPYASTSLSGSRPSQAEWSGGHATAPGGTYSHTGLPLACKTGYACAASWLTSWLCARSDMVAHPVRALTRHLPQCRHVHVPTCLPAGLRSTKSTCCSTADTPRLHTSCAPLEQYCWPWPWLLAT
jgi:hypothetical protein